MEHYKNKSENNNERIKTYLFEGERVLQNYKNFYATDRRLIQIKGTGFFDIAYKHITTIEYKRHSRIRVQIIGLSFALLGLVLLSNSIIDTGGFLFFIGLTLILIGLFRVNSYILHTAGNQKLEFRGGNDEETQNFLKVVRKQINE